MPRKKAPPSPFDGCTELEFRNSPLCVQWARNDPTYKLVISAYQNGFAVLPPNEFEGYRRGLQLLLNLRTEIAPPQKSPPVDFKDEPEGLGTDAELAED